MYRAPVRPQRSPGAPRPAERFSSPASCWGFPAARSSFNGSGHRGASPQGCPAFSPGSPAYSPGSDRVYRDRSPAGFGRGSRGFGGQMWRRGDGFRRLPFSPNFQSPDSSVEKYFSPLMLQDPWAALRPITAADAAAARHTT
ncbi:M-phase-specific PLK1-interacting protein [Anabas testudineus]|uniref:M-phase-specific PLK1-interacting protein n=1 Tax=Anabas testudineus TaxID=64144 RepID=UPI000E45BE7A|nr:M-phase-specific PLK1-interacting protein [Anabas testudineus]